MDTTRTPGSDAEGPAVTPPAAEAGRIPPQKPPEVAIGPCGDEEPPREQPGAAGEGARLSLPRLGGAGGRKLRKTVRADAAGRRQFHAQERVLLLDSWMRSRLPASDFASLVGVSPHTLYEWRRRFEESGPAGLCDGRRGGKEGSRLPEATQRAILMMKEAHPEWGQDRLHDMLLRGEGYGASPTAIGRVLREAGYVVEIPAPAAHAEPQRFERLRPNELWQTDLFTFLLRRENRRVHLVSFMDDYSRFIVGYGLHASASGALVREVFEAAVANFGAPVEVLTDNGTQYKTWRGTSAFTRLLTRRGIRHVVASPRHPATLGKVERFWGTLWREMLEKAIFQGLEDARRRIGFFIDYYNFQRAHQGLARPPKGTDPSHPGVGRGLVPADRYFESAAQVRATLEARVEKNAAELARDGTPRKPFYFTGRVGDASISLHAEGEKVVLVKEGGVREEVDLSAPGRRSEETSPLPLPVAVTAVVPDAAELDDEVEEGAPGTSPLDASLERLGEVGGVAPLEPPPAGPAEPPPQAGEPPQATPRDAEEPGSEASADEGGGS